MRRVTRPSSCESSMISVQTQRARFALPGIKPAVLSRSTSYSPLAKPIMWYRGVAKPIGEGACNVAVDIPPLTPPRVSKSDEDFLKDGVEFMWGIDGIDIEELNSLFSKVGFPRRDPVKLQQALENTHTTLWLRAAKQTRWAAKHQLLGFARATSDGSLTATIWDVAVHPAWQRVGLGRALVERLVASLCESGVPLICLYAEPNVVLLYEKLGFEKDVQTMKGMGFQRKSPEGQAVISAALQ